MNLRKKNTFNSLNLSDLPSLPTDARTMQAPPIFEIFIIFNFRLLFLDKKSLPFFRSFHRRSSDLSISMKMEIQSRIFSGLFRNQGRKSSALKFKNQVFSLSPRLFLQASENYLHPWKIFPDNRPSGRKVTSCATC